MNLLFVPPQHQRQMRYRSELGFRLTWFMALAFLASQAFIVPVWSYYAMTRAEVRLRSIKASELARAASEGLAGRGALLAQTRAVQSMDGVLRSRQPVAPLLAAVERTIPEGVGLSSASLTLVPSGPGPEAGAGGAQRRPLSQHELVLEGVVRGPDSAATVVRWREQLVQTLPARVFAVRGGSEAPGASADGRPMPVPAGAERFQLRFTLEPLTP